MWSLHSKLDSGLFPKLFLCDVVDMGIIGAESFFFFLVYFTFLIGFGEEMQKLGEVCGWRLLDYSF